MIWEEPYLGKLRIKKKFAWYPQTIYRHTVWLQCYYVLEKFGYWDELWFPYWEGVFMALTREQLEANKKWQEQQTA